jgi:lipoprotein-releasing system ATP-binding protein
MADQLLTVHGLIKDFASPGGALRVLDGLDLELSEGESLAVMGPSGSGKSTLLNILGTLDSPTQGKVLFQGEDIHAFSPSRAAEFRNRKIGFVFQDHHLLPQCTALENVLLPRLALGKVTSEAATRAKETLNAVGLTERISHFPSQLSGGERQRVAIARAMMNLPKLLLCDEPTGDLDSENAEVIAKLLLELHQTRNTAVIIVTHNAAIAHMFGRVRTLKGGKLRE